MKDIAEIIEFFRNATKEQINEIHNQKDWKKFLGIEIENLYLDYEPEEGNELEFALDEKVGDNEYEYYVIFERIVA